MKKFAASIRDPFVTGMLVALALVVAAFLTIGYTWRGVARLLLVPFQFPYVVSGGLFALGMLALGLAVMRVQVDRLHGARTRELIDAMVRDIAEAIPTAQARRRKGR